MIVGVTTIPDEALITVNTLELLGIIYLAIALARVRERISNIEGKLDQQRANHKGD